MTHEPTLHATAVVFMGRGILLRGPSGSGKSDLALRLMQEDGVLIADDHLVLSVEKGALHAAAPEAIKGLMEIRGIGLMRVPSIEKAKLDLCFDCVTREEVQRLPDKSTVTLKGVALPLFKLYPFEASAVAKIRALLQYEVAHD